MIDNSWDKVWGDFTGLNLFGKLMMRSKEKEFKRVLDIFIPKDYSVIDIGTGSGNVLEIFRKLGYKKSIGIDVSPNAIVLCVKKGFMPNKDVFYSSSNQWKKQHDVVWSDGLLEHYNYVDMKEIAKDFVRISKRFIGFVQPNPDSIISKLSRKSDWEWERPYKKKTYISLFESLRCRLIHFSYIHFKEQYFFIFEKDV